MKNLNVGLIGYGFMGRAHSNAYRQVNQFFQLDHHPVLKAVCARKADQANAFAENWGYESVETDWRKLIERDDIDLIDICSPNNTHLEIAVAAAEAGKMVLCEKPLAMNADEGAKMVEAVTKAGVPNMVWFNYRRVPAVSLAKQIVDEHRIGRPFHYRALYLQDWTIAEDVPQGGATLWRLDIDAAGSGVTGDLLAHAIDTAMWLNGPIVAVSAATETFVKERVHQETGKTQPVGIDDACMVLTRFANGSMGTFEATRYARGRKNYNTFELNGADGSIFFDFEDAHRLQYYEYRKPGMKEKEPSHLAGWRSIHVTNPEHPYMDKWWVPGCAIGYEHTFIHALADFLKGIEEGTPAMPDFADALRTQLVCDAILRSAKSGSWEQVP